MQFNQLLNSIQEINTSLKESAAKAVNTHLTIRNWLIGFYIVEFEQNGEERAKYGENLEDEIAKNINEPGLSSRNLRLFKRFYITYPQILQTLSAKSNSSLFGKMQTPSAIFEKSKILIPDEHFFIDLKTKAFKHHNAAQLNTYLNYYKENEILEGDNPPVGILLVADKNNTLVEYATAGMDENLFVQKYLIQLPSKQELEDYLTRQLNN